MTTRTRAGGREAFYAIQRLRSVRRRWEAREATTPRGSTLAVLRQCSACGNGARDVRPAGGDGPTCRRCGADLTPDASTRDWPTVTIGSRP